MDLPSVHSLHKAFFSALFVLLFLINPGFSRFHDLESICLESAGNYTDGSTYKNNRDVVLSSLTSQASLALFNTDTAGEGIDKAYGLYMCEGDFDGQQCHDCVEAASVTLTEDCPAEVEAIVWYEECMVRYANRPIFNVAEYGLTAEVSSSKSKVSDPEQFGKVIAETMGGLIMEAAYNASRKGYATAEATVSILETWYTMAQCTPDIRGSRCERCLRVALTSMAGCCGNSTQFISIYFPSCWLRYAPWPLVRGASALHLALEPPTSQSSLPPSPQGKFIAATLIPTGIRSSVLLLMMAIGIPNVIMAL